ncbi:CBS domain-containing protein [Acidiphilium angustum]|uniref:CBS domain-containing protein n=1 Tax=Acidiphilium angustum TaxID=523 RepID=UPI000493F72E|nr:CBS domain-containing protein [Acidiphilium angustum]
MSDDLFRPAASLDGDQDAILSHLERNTPVRLMATIGAFVAAYAEESVAEAVGRADKHRFDYLPVCDGTDGPVVGLFARKDISSDRAVRVCDVMQPLSSANLIAIDAPLLQFVLSADTAPCRLILDDTEIRGLVTLSDIQRLPVRTALFSLFIHLELVLTVVLRREIGPDRSPFEFLSSNRAENARNRWESSQFNSMDHDPYSALQFGDKKTIAKKLKLCGLSGTRIDRDLNSIEKILRNPIAHGANYALTMPAALELVRATRLVKSWIGYLRQ